MNWQNTVQKPIWAFREDGVRFYSIKFMVCVLSGIWSALLPEELTAPHVKLELYQIGIFRSVSVGISWYLPYWYRRKSRSVHFGIIFLAGTPFSLKRGHWPPFWVKKGAPAPFLTQPAPLLRKKGVPAKLVIPTEIPTAQLNLIPAKYRYRKTAGNTVVYNSMWNGTSDCAFSQSFVLLPWTSSCSDSHGKCAQHENLLLSWESVHVDAVASDRFAILLPSPPSSSPLVVCCSHNCAFAGSRCSVKISHELITLGSGNISKCAGICLGKLEWRILVSLSLLRCQSQERVSVTLFFFSGNHWLYPLTLPSMMRHAWCQAALTRVLAWMSSSPCLVKFVFLIYLLAIVLSVMGSVQSPFVNLLLIRSIQGEIIASRYSSRLFVAWKRSSPGTLKRHANPWLL